MLRGMLLLAPAVLGLSVYLAGAETPIADRRTKAEKLYADGNYKEAFDVLNSLVLDPAHAAKQLADDFNRAVQCLRQLQRQHEIDAFREAPSPRMPTTGGCWHGRPNRCWAATTTGLWWRANSRAASSAAADSSSTPRSATESARCNCSARPVRWRTRTRTRAAVAQFYYQLASAVQYGAMAAKPGGCKH